jgi:hypothetical protein
MDKLDIALVLGAAAVVAGSILLYKNRRKHPVIDIKDVPSEVVDGELAMVDIVGYFKQLSLTEGDDTPFIAKNCRFFKPQELLTKEGYETIIIGSYSMKDEKTKNLKIIHAKSFDKSMSDVIEKVKENDGLVVLQ